MRTILHLVGIHSWVRPLRDPEAAWCRVCGASWRAWMIAALPDLLDTPRQAYELMGPRRRAVYIWVADRRDQIPNWLWRLYRATWP